MKKTKQIFWHLLFPIQPKKYLTEIAEKIENNTINKQLHIYRIIQSLLFGLVCAISSLIFIRFFNTLIPLYIDRGGYDWIKIFVKIQMLLPFIAFLIGILLVNMNYFLLYFFSFINQLKNPINFDLFKKALIIGYADLSSTIILILVLILITINKKMSFFEYLISRNWDQIALQEQIILTFYKPITYIIIFLLFKTIIQLNSARKCAIIIEHIIPEKGMFSKSFKLALIPIFLKKAFLIALCLSILTIGIYLSQFLTAEFITL